MSLLERKSFSPHSDRRTSSGFIRLISIVAVLSIAVTALIVLPAGATQQPTKTDPIAKAKKKVAQARQEAAAAALKYSRAYGALSKINDNLADTQSRLEGAEESISTLQVKASTQAKDAYIRSSDNSIDQTYEEVVDESRRDQFLATVSDFDDAQLTTLVGMQEDLQIAKDELSELQKNQRATLANLAVQKKALDAKLAQAATAQKNLEIKAARDAKARKAARKRYSSKSSTSPGTIINSGSGPMACPIQGSLAFTNDWGNPRSGGRSHKGNDLFSPRGTPNVAVAAGTVTFKNSGLGGISAFLKSGNVTYYYTHLNDTVGGPRSVKRGEVLGHTGNTGNARGGATHTHFEIWKGGTKVNPYATLRSIC
jgi:murein DD-endopeptidase MepM/ murein hydrolase activator NlpD